MKKLSSPQKFDSMSTCTFLCTFLLAQKKYQKKAQIGHHGRQFGRSIQLLYYCMAQLPFAINSTKVHGFVGGATREF